MNKDEAPPRPPQCVWSPLLWSLLPLMAGILAGRHSIAISLVGLVLLPCLLGILSMGRSHLPRTVIFLSYLAGVLLIQRTVAPPHPLWNELPPRETSLEMVVVELFNARKANRLSGVGRILQHDVPFDTVSGRLTAFYLETGALIAVGSRIQCRGVLTYLPALGEPQGFHLYLKNRDIFLNLNRGTVLQQTGIPGAVERVRQRLFHKSQALLTTSCNSPTDPGQVLASMLLGKRSLLTEDRTDLYRQTGTYHLFAVSGLHVGSVALCLHWLAGLIRLPVTLRLLCVLTATWGYVWLTGSSPSAVRAGIMISCIGIARQLPRQPHLFPALAASAWIVLLWQPEQLFSLGFQLSYSVVGAIILMGLPLARYLRQLEIRPITRRGPAPALQRLLAKATGTFLDLACVSLSAGLGSMPLIIQHFSLFTPAGILLGILLNPLATYCVMTGSITLLCGLPAVPNAGYLALAGWPAIRIMEELLHFTASLPGAFSARNWDWPPTGTILLLCALSLAWIFQYLKQQGRNPSPVTLVLPHLLIIAALLFTRLQT